MPEDYVAQRAERRTNLICLTLFIVVMVAVGGAFLVTNRQWSQIHTAQQSINDKYQEAALKIDKLNMLEKQEEQMRNKAELAEALVERVPRSILLAELINRMPPRLSLLELELVSEKIKPPPPPKAASSASGDDEKEPSKGRLGSTVAAARRAKTKQEVVVEQDNKKIEAPRYKATLTMIGVAPTDLEVSRYMAELNDYPLLKGVSLDYSQEKDVDGRMMRQFKILMTLDPDADVRRIEPLIKPRIRNPMSDQTELKLRGHLPGDTVLTPTEDDGGH